MKPRFRRSNPSGSLPSASPKAPKTQEIVTRFAPNRWFHQHFNIGRSHARYLALHPPPQFHGHAEKVEDRAKDQIEYPDKAPFIRKKFEEELAKRGVKSLMPDEAYTNRNYEWSKAMGNGKASCVGGLHHF
jgi:hypothetical protein